MPDPEINGSTSFEEIASQVTANQAEPAGSQQSAGNGSAASSQQQPTQRSQAAPQTQTSPGLTPQAPAPKTSLIEALRQYGHFEGFNSDEEVLKSFQEMNRYSEIGKRFAHDPQFTEKIYGIPGGVSPGASQPGAQSSPQPHQPAQPEKTPWWNPPQINEDWYKYLQVDQETGLYAAPPNMPELIGYAHKINEYEQYVGERLQSFRSNPQQFIRDALSDHLQEFKQDLFKEWKEQATREAEQVRIRQEQEAYERDNLAKLYVLDANGQPAINPMTGAEVLTPYGEALSNQYQYAMSRGLPHDMAMQFATSIADAKCGAAPPESGSPGQVDQTRPALSIPRRENGQFAPRPGNTQQPTANPPSPQEANAQRKEGFLERAINGGRHSANRGGTVVAEQNGGPVQDENSSFLDIAKRVAEQQGVQT